MSWDSSGRLKSDANAFIFSLTNKDNQPVKITVSINPNLHKYAFWCHSSIGQTFGGGFDIQIVNNANRTKKSRSDLGYSYIHPQFAKGTYEAQTFLAGSNPFQLDEIEVFEKKE